MYIYKKRSCEHKSSQKRKGHHLCRRCRRTYRSLVAGRTGKG